MYALEWHPTDPDHLAVAHSRGVMLWRHIDAQRSPALHSQLALRGARSDWLPIQLAWQPHAPATCLAWHPLGGLLVAASVLDNALSIYDPLRPHKPPQRCRLGVNVGVHALRWSPCGQLLFAGRTDGTFQVFETLAWRSKIWSHRGSGYLVDAAWSTCASPPALLLVCSAQLFSLHFTAPPPALHAQLMPLSVPQVYSPEHEVSSGRQRDSSGHGVCL